MKSLARYERHSRFALMLHSLPPAVQKYAGRCEELLADIVLRQVPPVLAVGWP